MAWHQEYTCTCTFVPDDMYLMTCICTYNVQYMYGTKNFAKLATQSSRAIVASPSWMFSEPREPFATSARALFSELSFVKWSRIVYVRTLQSICAFVSSSQKPFAKAYSPDVRKKPVREAHEYLANWSAREESRAVRKVFCATYRIVGM